MAMDEQEKEIESQHNQRSTFNALMKDTMGERKQTTTPFSHGKL
jgi:hypothetical protein